MTYAQEKYSDNTGTIGNKSAVASDCQTRDSSVM